MSLILWSLFICLGFIQHETESKQLPHNLRFHNFTYLLYKMVNQGSNTWTMHPFYSYIRLRGLGTISGSSAVSLRKHAYSNILRILPLKKENFQFYLWLGPPCFNYWLSFTLEYSRISHEYSSLFIIVINLIFLCYRFDALTELRAFMRTEFLCISVLRVASEPRMKLVSCKSALNPRWFTLLTVLRRGPGLILLFVALWLRSDLFYVLSCVFFFFFFFVLVFFSPFSIAITSLGEVKANLSAFRTFVRFALVWFCRFSLPGL